MRTAKLRIECFRNTAKYEISILDYCDTRTHQLGGVEVCPLNDLRQQRVDALDVVIAGESRTVSDEQPEPRRATTWNA